MNAVSETWKFQRGKSTKANLGEPKPVASFELSLKEAAGR